MKRCVSVRKPSATKSGVASARFTFLRLGTLLSSRCAATAFATSTRAPCPHKGTAPKAKATLKRVYRWQHMEQLLTDSPGVSSLDTSKEIINLRDEFFKIFKIFKNRAFPLCFLSTPMPRLR